MTIESDKNILADFLNNPDGNNNINAFAKLCINHARGYIAYNLNRGRIISRKSDNLQQDILDLAVEIVSRYLEPKDKYPAHMLFKYLKNQGYVSFEHDDSEEIYHIFKRQLFGYVNQEILKGDRNDDPQRAKLLRQIDRAIGSEEYQTITKAGYSGKLLYAKQNEERLEFDKPNIDYHNLLILAEQAIQETKTTPKLCQKLFEYLSGYDEFSNVVLISDLKKAIIETELRFLEFDFDVNVTIESPHNNLILKQYENAKKTTLKFIRQTHLYRFVTLDKLTDKQADLLCKALEDYFDDIIHKGDQDSIPSYFRNHFPEITNKEYSKGFKHIWDTTVHKAMNYFIGLIDNNSTPDDFGP